MKTSRRLTMCHRSGGDSRKPPFRPLPSMPTLRLQGRWLDESGFPIGAKVGVQVMPGRLVLEVMEPACVAAREISTPMIEVFSWHAGHVGIGVNSNSSSGLYRKQFKTL